MEVNQDKSGSADRPTVVIVHGWASAPGEGWLSWLARELQNRDYEVIVPQMPQPRQPDIDEWLETLRDLVGQRRQLILVGHSLGCAVLLEFMADLATDVVVEKLVLIAGFYLEKSTTHWPDHYLTNTNLIQLKARIRHSYVLYSDDDKMVAPERSLTLADKLDAKVIKLHQMGHFAPRKLAELPETLEIITEQ